MAKSIATPSKKKPTAPSTVKKTSTKATSAKTPSMTVATSAANPLAGLTGNLAAGGGAVPVTYAGSDLEQTASALRLFMGTRVQLSGGGVLGARPKQTDRYHTGKYFLNMLTNGDVGSVRQLQEKLFAAGMYSTNNRKLIRFGDRNDADTRQALSRAIVATYQAQQAGVRMTLDELLGEASKYQSADMLAGEGGGAKQPIRLTDPTAIRQVIDKTAPELIGRSLTAEENEQIITAYQALERGFQETVYAGGTGTDPDLGSLIETRVKALHPEEADLYGKFKQSGVLMDLINSTGGSPQPFEVNL